MENIAHIESAKILTYAELQELFITTMPLTNPPAAEGDTEDDIDVTPVEYLEFEEMRVPLWIVDTIMRASEVTGADPVYMMALADKESSFLPGNKASTSSAVGLFQFISSTWLEAVRSFGPKHGLIMEAAAIENQGGKLSVPDETKREYILGLRRNPFISALMAAEMMKRDKAKIEARLGRKLSRSEFYLSHFFGVDSASRFIALVDDTPKKSAESAFPAAARSNKSLFFAKNGKKTRELTVSEVYEKIDTMIDKRLNRYEDVSSRMTADATF
ncbi:transglycosylase SLT domain-containing protein [Microvirga sp. KLBC 81]|uniref:transglycosylase SLT domain-containing protein n=1 Tax=Microvirga sp. KLBC 81 TaxID=1862707 RepID=UPI00140424F3|nr:transglycosylase SLT domain-containing protein [Microvirga sp. KLBC 81]